MAWLGILAIIWRACAKNNSDPLPLQDHPLRSRSTSLSLCSMRVVHCHCLALICILFSFWVIVLSHGYTKANEQFWTRSSLWCDQCSEHHSARVVLGRFAFVRAPSFAEHLHIFARFGKPQQTPINVRFAVVCIGVTVPLVVIAKLITSFFLRNCSDFLWFQICCARIWGVYL